MKKYLLWSFERGSRPYDVICIVILAFIFLTPAALFHDRPDFMRVACDQVIRPANNDDGEISCVVKVKTGRETEQEAIDRLKASLGETVKISRSEPVYDSTGSLVAYSIWVVR